MKQALIEAETGVKLGHGGPFGSVVVKNGKVVGAGHNMVVVLNDPTCHGEVSAIKDACKRLGTYDLSGCDIYTTSEPCPMCLGAVMWANIKTIYYGCNTLDAEDIGFRDQKFYDAVGNKNYNLIETDKDECLKLFEDFKQKKNKVIY